MTAPLRVATVQPPSYLPSMGAALLLEIVLLTIGALVLLHAPRQTAAREPIQFAIDAPVLGKPKPRPRHQSRARGKVASAPQLTAPPVPAAPPTGLKPAEQAATPLAQAVTPPLPPPSPESAQAEATYINRFLAAVQAALVYPMAAREMGLQGRAKVVLVFLDGAVSKVHIVTTSGNTGMDRAAVAAVQNAVVPAPPEGLRGVRKVWVITVRFDLNSHWG